MTSHKPYPEMDRIAAAALREVIVKQFKVPVLATPSDEWSPPTNKPWLVGLVILEGPGRQGGVRLHMSEPLLDTLNASLGNPGGNPVDREGELQDLTGELCNMIAGRISAGLSSAGLACTLGTPVVAWGHERPPETGAGTRYSHTHWTCLGGTLILSVWMM